MSAHFQRLRPCARTYDPFDMDRLEALKVVAAEAARDELTFATNVAVASRIRAALEDPEIHIAAAARLIQSEPLLAARVVAMANSVSFNRSGRVVTDVGTAVSGLGMRNVRALSLALIVHQIASAPTDKAHKDIAAQLWQHTAHVASLSRMIARKVTMLDPDTALFAGLVHDVGSFYLLSRVRDYPILLEGEREDEHDPYEAAIGRAVVASLAVPEPIVAALEVVWQGYLASPPETLGDTVLLAKRLAPVQSPFLHLVPVVFHSHVVPIDMIVGEDLFSHIMAESAEEVASVTKALTF